MSDFLGIIEGTLAKDRLATIEAVCRAYASRGCDAPGAAMDAIREVLGMAPIPLEDRAPALPAEITGDEFRAAVQAGQHVPTGTRIKPTRDPLLMAMVAGLSHPTGPWNPPRYDLVPLIRTEPGTADPRDVQALAQFIASRGAPDA